MKVLVSSLLLLSAVTAFAKVDCTTEPKDKWKDEKAFKADLEKLYTLKVFKVTEGNCYEIYGKDKAGKKVEIYFNPVTGEKVKERIQ